MPAAISVELARIARERAAADRDRRDGILQAARTARRESRRLRDRALHERDRTLDRRWAYWAAGSLHEPPTFVPLSWETPAVDAESAEAAAVAQCRRTAAAILRVATGWRGALPPEVSARMPAVIALCEAAADRLEDDAAGAVVLLGACARACEALEGSLDSAWTDARGVALAAACHASARALRRALVDLHERGREI